LALLKEDSGSFRLVSMMIVLPETDSMVMV
jgi:hypothetical protein